MFSSTELIRKSKKVFDKLNDKEIEKAIILRDGKPSFMLLDFDTYEKLIEEYLALKENSTSNKKVKKIEEKKIEKTQTIVNKDEIETSKDTEEINEINDEDLQEALAKIEQLDINTPKDKTKDKDEHLKEFWE
jgi:PHD/YefM family antitoxin component YafN of YafNO toxin-antitoxin module